MCTLLWLSSILGSPQYSAIRKDEILPSVATWMDFENIMLSKTSQSVKVSTIGFHSYVGYRSETHRHRQQYGGYQREEWRGGVVKGTGSQIYGDGR